MSHPVVLRRSLSLSPGGEGEVKKSTDVAAQAANLGSVKTVDTSLRMARL